MHRFLLRLPKSLFAKVKRAAEQRGLSLNQHISILLQNPSGDFALEVANTSIDILRIQELYGESLEGILLYGSQARGDASQESDVDLLMVLKTEASIERKLYRVWDESSHFPLKLSPSFAKRPTLNGEAPVGSLWRELALDAKVLWEKDLILSQTLAQLRKQILNSNEAERKSAHGHGYWILKGA